MQIKIIKDLRVNKQFWIRTGGVFKARVLMTMPFQMNAPYQIIEGPYSGTIIDREFCMEVEVENEKVYTEKEWNDLKDHHLAQLKKEKDQTVLFQKLSRELASEIKKKNQENERLNFLVDVLIKVLRASTIVVEVLKEKKAN